MNATVFVFFTDVLPYDVLKFRSNERFTEAGNNEVGNYVQNFKSLTFLCLIFSLWVE